MFHSPSVEMVVNRNEVDSGGEMAIMSTRRANGS
jgi:hypothetical protein